MSGYKSYFDKKNILSTKGVKLMNSGKECKNVQVFDVGGVIVKFGQPASINCHGDIRVQLNFYVNISSRLNFNVPKLLDHYSDEKSDQIVLVMEKLPFLNLLSYSKQKKVNSTDAKSILKNVMYELLKYDSLGLCYSDPSCNNILVENVQKVYFCDLDQIDSEKCDPRYQSAQVLGLLYGLHPTYSKNGHKILADFRSGKNFSNYALADFHPCCANLTNALLSGQELAISEMLGLLE